MQSYNLPQDDSDQEMERELMEQQLRQQFDQDVIDDEDAVYEDDMGDMEENEIEDSDAQAQNQHLIQKQQVIVDQGEDDYEEENQDIVSNQMLPPNSNENLMHQQYMMQQQQQNMAFQNNSGLIDGDQMQKMRMRPQSAKINDNQYRFKQQQQHPQQQVAFQNNQMVPNQQNGWMPNQQQYNMMPAHAAMGISQQNGHFLHQIAPKPPTGTKKRPNTASRRNQLSFNPKKSSKPFNNINSTGSIKGSTRDIDSSKLRPKVISQDPEKLYEDVMKHKVTTNKMQEENTKLKARIQQIDSQMNRKDKIIDDLLVQQENYGAYNSGAKFNYQKIRVESHLVMNLKKKIKQIQQESGAKDDLIETLKRNVRNTRLQEMDIELKAYADECKRLRVQLEEVIRSKDTFADPEELKIIEEKFQQKDMLINQMQQSQAQFMQEFTTKDQENRQLAELVAEKDRRYKKAMVSNKQLTKYKKDAKERDKEIGRILTENKELKALRDQAALQIQELQAKNKSISQTVHTQQQRLQMSQQSNQFQQNNLKESANLTSENERLQLQNEQLAKKNQDLNQMIKQFQLDLQGKNELLAQEESDKIRFKNLSEKYMNDVAKLESQMERSNPDSETTLPKEKSKVQRPKDNVKRDSAMHQVKSRTTEQEDEELKKLKNKPASDEDNYEDDDDDEESYKSGPMLMKQNDSSSDDDDDDTSIANKKIESQKAELRRIQEASEKAAEQQVRESQSALKPKQGSLSNKDDDDENYDDDNYEDGNEEEYDEEEEKAMIDAAQDVFTALADAIIKAKASVRLVFNPYIFEEEVEGNIFELLSPAGLMQAMQDLGIKDITEEQMYFAVKVLAKPELDGAILLVELLTIMENFGLYDEDDITQQSPMKSETKDPMAQSSQQESNNGDGETPQQIKGQVDLSQLDQKSVKIMVMLMLFLLEQDITVLEFFQEVVFEQAVKSKKKSQSLYLVKSEDFFNLLAQHGIRKKANVHENLRQFLQLSENHTELLAIRTIQRALEQMASNEDFMQAIREDLLQEDGGDEFQDDNQQLNGMSNDQLKTVKEQNQESTHEDNRAQIREQELMRMQQKQQDDDDGNYSEDEDNYEF